MRESMSVSVILNLRGWAARRLAACLILDRANLFLSTRVPIAPRKSGER